MSVVVLNKNAEILQSSFSQYVVLQHCQDYSARILQRCLHFPECPERLVTIRDKLLQYELLERCVPVMVREGEEILLAHR
uniref:Uncharacterized protein n=1 Tax=Laticauda laticaudata TaxID=8630 RepID=A0A8C5RRX1_LATLA